MKTPFRKKFPSELKYPIKRIIQDYKNGLSLPQIHEKYGISMSNAYQFLIGANVMRNPSEAGLLMSGSVEWHKLTNIGKSKTRLISIPSFLLRDCGFNPSKQLQGKWHLANGCLILEIREKEE